MINADEIAAGLRAAIEDEALRQVPAGNIDQLTGMVPILTSPDRSRGIVRALVPDRRHE